MKLRDVAVIGLMRQKGKKAFVLLAMALGCATVVSLFSFVDTQRKAIETQFDEYGANIIILPKSDNLGLSYGGVNVSGVVANLEEIRLSDVEKIREIPNRANIRAVSPKLLGAVEVKNKEDFLSQVLLVGVFFDEELSIKSWWEITGKAPTRPDEVLTGAEVTDRIGVVPGDIILVNGRELTVSGVLGPTGSQDDNIVFADFHVVSSFLDKNNVVSLVEVSALCSDCPIEVITEQISSILPNANIKEVRQVMQQKMQTVEQFGKFALTVTMVIVAIGAVLIFSSMMGAVAERRQEIGVFRAVGYKRVHIATIILTEALILSAAAALLGTLSGLIISRAMLPALLNISGDTVLINPLLIGVSIPGVILVGMAATLYPALKAAKIDPVIAINSL